MQVRSKKRISLGPTRLSTLGLAAHHCSDHIIQPSNAEPQCQQKGIEEEEYKVLVVRIANTVVNPVLKEVGRIAMGHTAADVVVTRDSGGPS